MTRRDFCRAVWGVPLVSTIVPTLGTSTRGAHVNIRQPAERRYEIMYGRINTNLDEEQQGMFAVGRASALMVVPQGPSWYRLKELVGRLVTVHVQVELD